MGLTLTFEKHEDNSKKQLKTAHHNSVHGLIFEGLVIGRIFASEILGAYFQGGIFLEGLIIGILRFLIVFIFYLKQ